MLRRMMFALLGALLLTACGHGGEDFTVKIARTPSRVAAALDQVAVDEKTRTLFPGLKIDRSTPGTGQLFYDVPGNAALRAAVHFTFEPTDDGKSTIVHAVIDVPEVKVTVEQKNMVIRETKVEFAVREIVQNIGKKLEVGEDIDGERKKLSELLTILAVVTDSHNLALALDIEHNPGWYMAGLDWLGGGDGDADYPGNPYGNQPLPQDPGAAARQQEYRQQEAAREAAAPMNEAAGEEPRGDNANNDY